MVSPEVFHNYPFFNFLKPAQLTNIASIAQEETYDRGVCIYREREYTDWLYILVKGGVDLLFIVEADNPEPKELRFGEVRPGGVFGISALLESHIHISTARASQPSQVIKIEAAKLLALCNEDEQLAYQLMRQVAKTTTRRLTAARRQLAVALSPAKATKTK